MAQKLIIVESPAKTRTIAKYLGKDYNVIASMGHIIDLPEKELAVDLKANFEPKYVVIPGKEKTLEAIRLAAQKASQIYLASDPDREGEAIAFHIAKYLGVLDKSKRVLFNEITKPAIMHGLENPGVVDLNKVDAQQARRVLDRLVGYKVSPILWKILHKGLSAGRVQSVALKILALREDEIERFVPQEFWTLDLLLSKKGTKFPAKVTKLFGKKLEITNADEANQHKTAFESNLPLMVASIIEKDLSKNPLPPFITSTLQLEASRKLNFSAKKTMQLAQMLYEGLDLGEEGPVGLITYMRTDSVRISEEAQKGAKAFVTEKYGKEYVGKGVFAKSKNAQDAHEAIRPTYIDKTPAEVKNFLTRDQFKLYEMIWQRFVASQMSSAKLKRQTVEFASGGYTAETSATKVVFDGFLKLWDTPIADDEQEAKTKLPQLTVGEEVAVEEFVGNQHFTKPPARFTEGSLVKELETQGIGRPSTYAQIISTLLDRKYVKVEEKRLFVTELGKQVNTFLQKMFPDIFEEKFTARMEEELDDVESGTKGWRELLSEFYTPFATKLGDIKKQTPELKADAIEQTGKTCPKCGSPLIIRWGRFGKFVACSNFPTCRHTEPLDGGEDKPKPEVQTIDEKCPRCGADLAIKQSRRGAKFIACTKYPECDFTKALSSGVPCPRENCKGELVEMVSKKGKKFWKCSEQECDFVAFYPPEKQACPSCGAKTVFLRATTKKRALWCALCNWKIDVEQPET